MMVLAKWGKLATAAFWVLVVYNLISPLGGPLGYVVSIAGPAILGVHTLEAFFFIRKFQKQLSGLSAHAVQVLIFGVFHFLTVIQEQKSTL